MHKTYSTELDKSMPARIAALPVQNGYPVPYFVAEVEGKYDFRIADYRKFKPAIKKKLCWICGQKLGAYLAFTIGPMCAINRVISEPPSHRDCAEWAIKVCPFLSQRQEVRNFEGLPENLRQPAGIALKHQPQVTCLWVTKSYKVIQVQADPSQDIGQGLLFELGEATEVCWYKEGRKATREEVIAAVERGLPILFESAKQDGLKGIRHLEQLVDRAKHLYPEK